MCALGYHLEDRDRRLSTTERVALPQAGGRGHVAKGFLRKKCTKLHLLHTDLTILKPSNPERHCSPVRGLSSAVF